MSRNSVDMPSVYSIDGGIHVGWSLMVVHREALVDPNYPVLNNIMHWSNGMLDTRRYHDDQSGEPAAVYSYSGEIAVARQMASAIDKWPMAITVLEEFTIKQPNSKKDYESPIRFNSCMRYALTLMGRSWIMMDPQHRSITDARMKTWGFYKPGEDHSRDADRLSLAWLRKSRGKTHAARSFRHYAWPKIYNEDGDIL